MIVTIEGLEDFVQMFVEVGPKVLEWSKVLDTLTDVCHIMMVGFDHIGAIKLGNCFSTQLSVHLILRATYCDQLGTVFLNQVICLIDARVSEVPSDQKTKGQAKIEEIARVVGM